MKKITSVLFSALLGLGIASGAAQAADGSLDKIKARDKLIVGVFTDLSGAAPPGLAFSATIDSRYSTSPTLLKMLAMIFGVVLTVVALGALHVLDRADGVPHKRFLPSRWWSRRFELMAMTTGSVPMIIVGNGPPARWIALARHR